MNVTYAALALTGTVALAACGTQTGGGSGTVGGDVPVAGVRWIPEKLTVDGKDIPLPEGARNAHVTFKPGTAKQGEGGGQSGGSVGCNSIGADVEVEGDTVRVSDVASTEMGCPGPVQEFEEGFVRIFSGDLEARITEPEGEPKILTLTSHDGDSITLSSEAAPPLTGTTWTVDALTTGKGADAAAEPLPQAARGKAYLVLSKDALTGDGTVHGSLGCNTFSGKATVSDGSDGTIEFSRLATTRKLCSAPVMKTENEIKEILDGKVAYDKEHDVLTLTADSGKGLTARAEKTK
ncbi:heat-inducible protein [Streptomyces jeddahensis]|uniref:Heat-inducible protein n=2 Tax=Streptomyces jeddahensis TaxID=1716141 RepID=A0A177HVK7_9ACTN|nr:heat-inducible protein [Streptomyces jeddahensis]